MVVKIGACTRDFHFLLIFMLFAFLLAQPAAAQIQMHFGVVAGLPFTDTFISTTQSSS